jgi:ABC-type nitrate/sulfonate/bicarbonate transport system substrate-binding protein
MRSASSVSAARAPLARGRVWPLLRRRRRLRGLLVLPLAAACAGCGELHTDSSALGPARPLTIALSGPASALYAPLYVGVADGEFTRGALRVSLTAGSSDTASLDALESGQAQVAIASEPAVLAARADGERVVAIGALEDGALEAIISLRPLASPRALVGKKVGTDGTKLAAAELSSYLETAGLSAAQVRLVQASEPTARGNGAYAVVARWDLDAVALAIAHHRPNVVRVAAAGVPRYTDLAIVVRVGEARHQGALIRAFLQSLTRAEAMTRANPTGAAQILVRANPALSMRLELAALSATQTVAEPSAGNQPFGYQSPYAWQSFGEWMAARGLLRSAAVAGDTITDEFLPGQGE